MHQARAALKQMRILHAVFLLSVFLLFFVLVQVGRPEGSVPPVFLWGMAMAGATNILIAVVVRSRHLTPALEILRTAPDDAEALRRWRMGNVIGFVFSDSISGLGLVLKFLDAKWNLAGLFFAVAVFLLLVWAPRLDLPSLAE